MIYDYCIIHAYRRHDDSPDLREMIERRISFEINQMMALEFHPIEPDFSKAYDDHYSFVVASRRPSGYTRKGWPNVPIHHIGGRKHRR